MTAATSVLLTQNYRINIKKVLILLCKSLTMLVEKQLIEIQIINQILSIQINNKINLVKARMNFCKTIFNLIHNKFYNQGKILRKILSTTQNLVINLIRTQRKNSKLNKILIPRI